MLLQLAMSKIIINLGFSGESKIIKYLNQGITCLPIKFDTSVATPTKVTTDTFEKFDNGRFTELLRNINFSS